MSVQPDDDYDAPGSIFNAPGLKISVTIEMLFDFNKEYWAHKANESSITATLDEELEIWDILDIDADGEVDTTGSDDQFGEGLDGLTGAAMAS